MRLTKTALLLAVAAALLATAAPRGALAQGREGAGMAPPEVVDVPARDVFAGYLQRDLVAWFQSNGQPSATAVDWTLLREQPTKNGISYPKFYLWARVRAGESTLDQGALRIAAVAGTHFEVRNFVPAAEVNANPGSVLDVFPQALIPRVLERARGAK